MDLADSPIVDEECRAVLEMRDRKIMGTPATSEVRESGTATLCRDDLRHDGGRLRMGKFGADDEEDFDEYDDDDDDLDDFDEDTDFDDADDFDDFDDDDDEEEEVESAYRGA